MASTRVSRWGAIALLILGTAACSDEPAVEAPPPACTVAAPDALRICVNAYSDALANCYASGDASCAAGEGATTAALDTLQASLQSSCGQGDGFGSFSTEALVGRMRNACASEASAMAWRSYGGPQGAVWPAVGERGQSCLAAAHQAAAELVDGSLRALNDCLASASCDATEAEAERATLAATARADVEAACPDLASLIAVDADTFIERAAGQVDCLTSTGHLDTGALSLRCGPSHAQFDAPRGEWTSVMVDGDEWGTLCGDGSPYVFHIRFAPEGEPLDQLVIGLQGGGVCLFEDDCTARLQSSPELFTAMDDDPTALGFGIMSDDPEQSPFANWTKVYLPYCTQDVFAGGGVEESLGALSLPRHGSVNMRSAVQMVRDVLWKKMDEAGGDGFRPDEVLALFGGWSAGGYGTLYNYHWFIDDLQWPRTSAFPDAGLALDNGSPLGVSGLGLVKIPAWGMQPNLPPYCFAGECAVGEVVYQAISPRLKQVPEQQMLILSNPLDLIQQGDAFFDDTAAFINEMRSSYCDTKDLPGIQYYFTSVSDESIHVVSLRPTLWEGSVDGEVMRDWFWRAVTDADSLADRAEEADFVSAVPGVEPYPCQVAP